MQVREVVYLRSTSIQIQLLLKLNLTQTKENGEVRTIQIQLLLKLNSSFIKGFIFCREIQIQLLLKLN